MRYFYLLSLAALLLGACTKNPHSTQVHPGEDWDAPVEHEMIVLGDQLNDPYTVENMEAAFASLYPVKSDRVVLEATDLYVRFLPKDKSQYEFLLNLGLQLVDHPVDYQIVKDGDYYHDPQIAEGDITWQYTVVPMGFKFPNGIEYEILDECFIAEKSVLSKSSDIDWEAVERESYRLTGNETMLLPETKAEAQSPAGRITISDPDYSEEPQGVKGVMVFCNSFVKFARAYTDENGYYQMRTSFSGKPRYRLVFKNKKGFCIGFNLLLIPASVSAIGKAENSGVNLHITSDSEKKLFARSVVNNAAYDYYESCASEDRSISLPPSNLRIWLLGGLSSSSTPMLHHGAFVESGIVKEFLGEYVGLLEMFLPDITIGIKNIESYSSLYLQAIHELAHASHFMQVGREYWDTYINYILYSFVNSGFEKYGSGTEMNHGYCEVGEMWAYYMQSSFCRTRYPDMNTTFGTQFWFSPQILVYLEDRGINRFKIFEALKDDVTDRELLQERLILLWPEAKSVINQAFGRYN